MILDPRSEPQSESRSSGHSPAISLPVHLMRAVFALGLGANQSRLLWHVLERSWSGGRKQDGPIPCPIDGAALAASWGIHRNCVSRAKQGLVSVGIITPVEGGFVVNSDVNSWADQEPCKNSEIASAGAGKRKRPRLRSASANDGTTQAPMMATQAPALSRHATERAPARAELNSIQSNSIQSSISLDYAEVVSRDEAQPAVRSPMTTDVGPTRESDCRPQGVPVSPVEKGPAAHDPDFIAAGKELRRAFGDAAAERLKKNHAAIGRAIGGRWDYFRQAVLNLEAKQAKPGAETILDVMFYFQRAVKGMIAEGKELPIAAGPRVPSSRATTPIPPIFSISPERRAQLEASDEAERERWRLHFEAERAKRRRPASEARPGDSMTIGEILAARPSITQNGEC